MGYRGGLSGGGDPARAISQAADHSGEPLGDPSARVFEVFLIGQRK